MKAYITFDHERLKRAMLADLSDDELVRVRGMEAEVIIDPMVLPLQRLADIALELAFTEVR
jgi:hypothetical protein